MRYALRKRKLHYTLLHVLSLANAALLCSYCCETCNNLCYNLFCAIMYATCNRFRQSLHNIIASSNSESILREDQSESASILPAHPNVPLATLPSAYTRYSTHSSRGYGAGVRTHARQCYAITNTGWGCTGMLCVHVCTISDVLSNVNHCYTLLHLQTYGRLQPPRVLMISCLSTACEACL